MVNHIKTTERNKEGFSRFLFICMDGMPVKCRGYPVHNFVGTHLYTWVGRDTELGVRNDRITEPGHQLTR